MYTTHKIAEKERGMTFVEAIVWVAVSTAVMVAIVSSLVYFYRTNRYAIEAADQIASGTRGIDLMTRTLREASYSTTGEYPIVSMGSTTIVFYADINANTSIEKVTFYLQGNTLMGGVVEPTGNPPVYTGATSTSDVSYYVQNVAQGTPIFKYYNASGVEITDYTRVADVRFITITVIIDVNTQTIPTQLTLRSSATLRNLVGH